MSLRVKAKVYGGPLYTLTPLPPMVMTLSAVLRVDCGEQMWKGKAIEKLYHKFFHTVTYSSTCHFMILGSVM